jgi:hypothetical protein
MQQRWKSRINVATSKHLGFEITKLLQKICSYTNIFCDSLVIPKPKYVDV